MLQQDVKVREYLKRKLAHASVGRILIERPAKNARVTVYSARPGVVIGKKGEDIEALRSDLQRIMGVPVHVSIEEIRKPEIDAQLIADSIAQQLEKRIMFRRAMKRAMQNAMRLGAQGIKVWVYKGDMLNRNEQPAVEEVANEERRPRRAPGKTDGDKPRTRTVKKADGEAPAKRVRKAGA